MGEGVFAGGQDDATGVHADRQPFTVLHEDVGYVRGQGTGCRSDVGGRDGTSVCRYLPLVCSRRAVLGSADRAFCDCSVRPGMGIHHLPL